MEPSEKDVLVSVVVPVFNVQDYLCKCIDSILVQTHDNMEVILVDDGSTDASSSICDEYAKKDRRVRVIHKDNGGLSDARNCGLSKCTGDWVSFIDSDDFVAPVWLEALLHAALSCECRMSGIRYEGVFQDGLSFETEQSSSNIGDSISHSARDVIRAILYQAMACGVQGFLYERALLGTNPFPKGLYYEDLASTYRYVHEAGRVAIIDCERLYAYRVRKASIIRQSYRHIKGQSALVVADQLYRDISTWYPDLVNAASSRCFSVCRMVFGQVPSGADATEEERTDRQALWQVIERHRNVVRRDPDARLRERLAAMIACAGEGPFSAFCALARRLGLMQ